VKVRVEPAGGNGTLMSPDIDLIEHQLRPVRGEPRGALVLLHGRGTNEFDLLPLLDELDPDRRLLGITLRAPLELSPGGFHWYLSRAVGYPDRDTFRETYGLLARWLGSLPQAIGVPWRRTVLGGFSMGAVMSYALGLSTGRPEPGGILALSGFLPTVEGFELDLHGREGLDVAIGHGSLDPVIPVEFGRDARRRLEAAGARVLYRESPIFHGIDPTFIPVLQAWLADVAESAGEPRSPTCTREERAP
jgi:phospholipase/carboxylesterase